MTPFIALWHYNSRVAFFCFFFSSFSLVFIPYCTSVHSMRLCREAAIQSTRGISCCLKIEILCSEHQYFMNIFISIAFLLYAFALYLSLSHTLLQPIILLSKVMLKMKKKNTGHHTLSAEQRLCTATRTCQTSPHRPDYLLIVEIEYGI